MTTTNSDLQRSLGRVEGEIAGMRDRMDRLERQLGDGLEKIGETMSKMDTRLAGIEARDNQQKGAWRAMVAITGTVSAIVSIAVAIGAKIFGH